MKIRTIQYQHDLAEEIFQQADTYVIDVFRATSVIVTALAHGASEVIATAEIHESLQQKQAFPASVLGGERNSVKPPEFDFGNSPAEYFNMRGRRLVLSTSNGTRAIKKTRRASATYICAFLNLQAVIDQILSRNQDVVLLMAGVRETFSYEDGLCAGAVLHGLAARQADMELDDLSLLLQKTFDMERHQLPGALQATFAYTKLARHGFASDIAFCLQENVYHQLPQCRFGADGVSISFN